MVEGLEYLGVGRLELAELGSAAEGDGAERGRPVPLLEVSVSKAGLLAAAPQLKTEVE